MRRESRLCERTCSIATRSHPHTASADTRHSCATHNYERGMSLWEVQKILGHDWATTTVRYLASVHAEPEHANLAASALAAQRLVMDKGNLR
ncbi:tyrosine-type recombinase/integrase [Streptomyces rishiriensis]|uniref:tyrosine-type recombinase/integrase n=1 Tax=Streptomyces rishiriensis TaxID=68264 RepID=UPI003794A3AE